MDWQCDVYLYSHAVDGWTIDLAGRRFISEIPPITASILTDPDEFMEQHIAQLDAIEVAASEPITLPRAGESICVYSLDELKTTMLELRAIGYRFPDHLLAAIDEEMSDADSA